MDMTYQYPCGHVFALISIKDKENCAVCAPDSNYTECRRPLGYSVGSQYRSEQRRRKLRNKAIMAGYKIERPAEPEVGIQ